MRDHFDDLGFIDIETPMLGRSTPEGARDYLVPSRLDHGSFFALPQSPQLYKQLLMMAGFDRYVQVARCFRDEDLRADRQPEFTQLDLEMSFVESDDVMNVVEGLVVRTAKEILDIEVPLPLPRLSWDECMERFGHDAPDLRFGLEIRDLTDFALHTDFRVFRSTAESGGRVRGILVPDVAVKFSRKDLDALTSVAVEGGAKGLVWLKVEPSGELSGPVAKNLGDACVAGIIDRLGATAGDLILIVADTFEISSKSLHMLRKRLGCDAPPFPGAENRRFSKAAIRPYGMSGAGLRSDYQRFGSGRWNDSHTRSAGAAAGIFIVGHLTRRSTRTVWFLARCAAIRCAAAWWHCTWNRSIRHAVCRFGFYS